MRKTCVALSVEKRQRLPTQGQPIPLSTTLGHACSVKSAMLSTGTPLIGLPVTDSAIIAVGAPVELLLDDLAAGWDRKPDEYDDE